MNLLVFLTRSCLCSCDDYRQTRHPSYCITLLTYTTRRLNLTRAGPLQHTSVACHKLKIRICKELRQRPLESISFVLDEEISRGLRTLISDAIDNFREQSTIFTGFASHRPILSELVAHHVDTIIWCSPQSPLLSALLLTRSIIDFKDTLSPRRRHRLPEEQRWELLAFHQHYSRQYKWEMSSLDKI